MKYRPLPLFLVIVFALTPSTLAQHKRSDGPGGGKTEITLPVPKPTRGGGRAGETVKETLQLVTITDDGYWYYQPTNVEILDGRYAAVLTAYQPRDLLEQRLASYKEHKESPNALMYLSYVGSIYRATMDCATGQYRFASFIDVTNDSIITAEATQGEFAEWRFTTGTPWEFVRKRVCPMPAVRKR